MVGMVKVADGGRTGELKGKSALNDKHECIGTIDDLIIGIDKVHFGILQVGAFSEIRRQRQGIRNKFCARRPS